MLSLSYRKLLSPTAKMGEEAPQRVTASGSRNGRIRRIN